MRVDSTHPQAKLMRRLIAILVGAMALSSAAQADRVSLTDISAQLAALLNQGAVQMQYCGMTTAETSGDTDGIGELDDMCGAEFPGSRACTAEEISDTQYLGVLPDADFGWVRGEFTYTKSRFRHHAFPDGRGAHRLRHGSNAVSGAEPELQSVQQHINTTLRARFRQNQSVAIRTTLANVMRRDVSGCMLRTKTRNAS